MSISCIAVVTFEISGPNRHKLNKAYRKFVRKLGDGRPKSGLDGKTLSSLHFLKVFLSLTAPIFPVWSVLMMTSSDVFIPCRKTLRRRTKRIELRRRNEKEMRFTSVRWFSYVISSPTSTSTSALRRWRKSSRQPCGWRHDAKNLYSTSFCFIWSDYGVFTGRVVWTQRQASSVQNHATI